MGRRITFAVVPLAGLLCAQAQYQQQLDQAAVAAHKHQVGQFMLWQLDHPAVGASQPDLQWEARWRDFCALLAKYEKSRQAGLPDARVWKKLRLAAKELFQ